MKIFSFLTIALLVFSWVSQESHAAQTAVVSVPQAIIYADRNLTSPIGFIRNGKKIRVGEVKRKRGTILPIVVSGRIAYIQTKDITLSRFGEDKDEGPRNPRITEHDVDELFEETEDKLNQNNFLVLDLGQFTLGTDWELLESEFGIEETKSASSLKLIFEHRPPLDNLAWGMAVGFYSLSEENLEISSITLEGTIHWVPLRFRYFSVSLMGGVIISGALGIKTSTIDSLNRPTGTLEKNSGNMFGYQIGGQVNFLPYSRIGFVAGLSLKNLFLSGLDPIETPSGEDIDLGSFSGFSLHAGISYKF